MLGLTSAVDHSQTSHTTPNLRLYSETLSCGDTFNPRRGVEETIRDCSNVSKLIQMAQVGATAAGSRAAEARFDTRLFGVKQEGRKELQSVLTGTHKRLVVIRRGLAGVRSGELYRATSVKEEMEEAQRALALRGKVERERALKAWSASKTLQEELSKERQQREEGERLAGEKLRGVETKWRLEWEEACEGKRIAESRVNELKVEAMLMEEEGVERCSQLKERAIREKGRWEETAKALREALGLLRMAWEAREAAAAEAHLLKTAAAATAKHKSKHFDSTRLAASLTRDSVDTKPFTRFPLPPGLCEREDFGSMSGIPPSEKRAWRLVCQFRAGEALGRAIILTAHTGPAALLLREQVPVFESPT